MVHNLRESPLTFKTPLDSGQDERKSDTLDLLPYAEALRDFIHECETPVTIGVQGEWGVGKTSLMNMLRGSEDSVESGLLDQVTCIVVSFEAWSYSQFNTDTDLAVACLMALAEGLAATISDVQEVDGEALDDLLASMRERIRSVLACRIGTAAISSPELLSGEDISAQMIAFRRELFAMVRLWTGSDRKRRVVFFVDDIDRLRPPVAVELLEAIKNFATAPGCVFVLAVDYGIVQMGMAEKFGREAQKTNGKAFYDKIVQLPFVMPANTYRLDDYLIALLREASFPGADEVARDPAVHNFYLDITLCTVGRNPREIKRVMTYANLLERIRQHTSQRQLDAKDARILYSLVCTQIAWPEIYDHFVNEPTVDTITSLQSWDYLENLPEARALFDRSTDELKVKNDISTFFDTLFGLLDENDDGQIDTQELEPVLNVMDLVRMTAVETRERPREYFVRRVRENNAGRSTLIESFLENVFMKSVWYLGSECKYHKSGSRYVTIVHDRTQIGSLVSLRSNPFVIRLAMPPGDVSEGLREYLSDSKHSVRHEAVTLARNKFGSEASMIGFGDTVIDFGMMTNIPSKEAIGLMNALFRIVTIGAPGAKRRKGKKKRK